VATTARAQFQEGFESGAKDASTLVGSLVLYDSGATHSSSSWPSWKTESRSADPRCRGYLRRTYSAEVAVESEHMVLGDDLDHGRASYSADLVYSLAD